MKVHSVHGPTPERARPPENAPGLRTQADIAARMRPRADMTEKTFNDLPIFKAGKPLCGPDVNKDTLTEFIKNSLRSRSLIQEWLLTVGDEYQGNVQWRPVISSRELQKMNVQNIASVLADALAREDRVVHARISTKDGIAIGFVAGDVTGLPSLTVWHKQIT